MVGSILTSIKNMLGITDEYEHFDSDIIAHINSVFVILNQLGVGPTEGFYIQDKNTMWVSYISDPIKVSLVKSYMFLRVKLLFDPPNNSTVIESMKNQIAEMEWRLTNGGGDTSDE